MKPSADVIARMLEDAKHPGLEVTAESWFNLWHTHADWEGIGNASPSARASALQALFTKFRAILKQLANCSVPTQVWACICPNSADDSVCVHSPNPSAPFPYAFPGVVWGVPVPELLLGHFNEAAAKIGASPSEEGPIHWVLYQAGEI